MIVSAHVPDEPLPVLLYKEGEPLKDLSNFLVDGEGKYVEVSLASHQKSYMRQFSPRSKDSPHVTPSAVSLMLQVRIPAECMSNANRQVRDVQNKGQHSFQQDTMS